MIDPKRYPVLSSVLAADADPDATYKIIRMYKDDHPKKVMKKGLSLEEAQEWCRDPETSSRKATSPEAKKHTEQHGDWFDGYEEE